jgi:sulfopropanediol 3-dehydrogenase
MTARKETHSTVASTVLKAPALKLNQRGSTPEVRATVEGVINDIRDRGDEAVREYSKKFDNYAPETFRLSEDELDTIIARVPEQVVADITFVQEQVRIMARRASPSRPSAPTSPVAGTRSWPART